ncbi:MAG: hypothetical protein H6Q70_2909 [Firmicutes bacterium]|jgi:hypothetical protein|nr:hypothetical protein [Bacillota bacterium]
MENSDTQLEKSRTVLYLTVTIVIIMMICSSIGIWQENFYFREMPEWLTQCVGQDISNLFFIAPVLLISAFYANTGNRMAKIIWIGVMIANIYSYVLYCFAVHFNYMHLIYCFILGLSNFSAIYFFFHYLKEDFKAWFTDEVPTKLIGIFLILLAVLFGFLWLSEDLPAVFKNSVPESIIKNGLITNPVHVLDYTLYLPMMFIAGVMLIKKKSIAYLLAPMMLVFAIIININIVSLMIVAQYKNISSDTSLIFSFVVFTMICVGFLWLMIKRLK